MYQIYDQVYSYDGERFRRTFSYLVSGHETLHFDISDLEALRTKDGRIIGVVSEKFKAVLESKENGYLVQNIYKINLFLKDGSIYKGPVSKKLEDHLIQLYGTDWQKGWSEFENWDWDETISSYNVSAERKRKFTKGEVNSEKIYCYDVVEKEYYPTPCDQPEDIQVRNTTTSNKVRSD